jgi:hypothetical protein
MRRRTLLGAGCGLLSAGPARAEAEVDLLLVLAADVSQSMRDTDLRLQRQGYAAALRDEAVQAAIASGPHGAIALLYLEWSGVEDQRVVVPWTRLGDAGAVEAASLALDEAPVRSGTWTSISAAITAARGLVVAAPFAAHRCVLDISGDGENNAGPPAEQQRDAAVAEGIVINGLPILRPGLRRAAFGRPGETALEEHYRDAVTGGPGAFVLPAQGLEAFADAIRRKLILEIAGRSPDASIA